MVIISVLLALNQLQSVMKELQSFLFATCFQHQQGSIIIGCAALLLPHLSCLQKTSKSFGILI